MDDKCGEWVESTGVASVCGKQEVGGIYGCGYNVSVVSECCCKEAYRFPHNINYLYSICISALYAAASLLLCSF